MTLFDNYTGEIYMSVCPGKQHAHNQHNLKHVKSQMRF